MSEESSRIKPFRSIMEHYEVALDNIEQRSRKNISLIHSTNLVWPVGPYDNYCTIDEAREIEKELRTETDKLFVLELTASFEAKLVSYFRNHVKRRSAVHAVYRTTVRKSVYQRVRPLMFNDMLSIFKELIYPFNNVAYSNVCNLVDYRNWLAHGRGWSISTDLEAKFDVEYTFNVIEAIVVLLPSFPNSLRN